MGRGRGRERGKRCIVIGEAHCQSLQCIGTDAVTFRESDFFHGIHCFSSSLCTRQIF